MKLLLICLLASTVQFAYGAHGESSRLNANVNDHVDQSQQPEKVYLEQTSNIRHYSTDENCQFNESHQHIHCIDNAIPRNNSTKKRRYSTRRYYEGSAASGYRHDQNHNRNFTVVIYPQLHAGGYGYSNYGLGYSNYDLGYNYNADHYYNDNFSNNHYSDHRHQKRHYKRKHYNRGHGNRHHD